MLGTRKTERTLRLSVMLMLVLLSGCIGFTGFKTEITLTGGTVPTFGLSGSGKIVDFILTGPQQRQGEGLQAFTVWEFRPLGNIDNQDTLDRLRSVKYGEVPKGYRQLYPENDSLPPPLKEGESYLLQIYTDNAPWGQIAFEIRDGKAIEKPIK